MKKLLILLITISCLSTYAQTKRIKILSADNTYTDEKFPGATITLGNVFVEHEGATLRCDKAYIYQETKLIKALGNVIINQGDTIHQYSKYADYNGNKKLATSWGDVVLKDELMTLKTDTLRFNRINQQLYYDCGGTIKDTTNFLKSDIGRYYLKINKFEAYKNVEVINPDSKLVTNHLEYYTSTGIADVFGPSTITSENNRIYTEKGRHNSKTNISHFIKNSKIYYDDRTIQGDSLYYNKNIEFASATGNIKLTDTINKALIKGDYAEFYKLKDSAFVNKRAVAISEIDNDSIYIHGDILMITGKPENRIMRAYNHVKIFKSDLQGKCDSLISFQTIGLTKMITEPVLWAQENQITGDTIHLISNPKTENLDSLKILGNAFMIKKDPAGFSQLKGKNMYGKFLDNELNSLDVVGNSEAIFYLRDDNDVLMGIEKISASSNIFITFKDEGIETISYFNKPSGNLYPPSIWKELNPLETKFKGFIWREEERPRNKLDIFLKDKLKKNSSPKNNIELQEPELENKAAN